MRIFLTLLTKELRAFFFSPVAYVVLALVMIINGFSFRAAIAMLENAPQQGSIVTWTFNSQWFWLSYFFVFPLLTMRLFAEERKLGTWETLFTAPVRTWQVLSAKYLASVIFYCLLWLPSLANFGIFQTMTAGAAEIPKGALLGTYLLLFVMGLFNLAMGCFASSLTSNQIVAAVMSFTFSLMHYLVGLFVLYLGSRIPPMFVDMVRYIATIEHIKIFVSGLLDTRVVVYYASLAALFLAFTHQVLEFRRWRV
jgi:ABC-2 type transport system permease protein